MRVLMLWKLYPACLDYFYAGTVGVDGLSFEEQREALLSSHFAGWPGDIGRCMERNGITVEFIVPNAKPMQYMWAREKGFSGFADDNWEKTIALEQIKVHRPDVLWLSSCFDYFDKFLDEALVYADKAFAWISCPFPEGLDVSKVHTLLTSQESLLNPLLDQCSNIVVGTVGFETSMWNELQKTVKKHDAIFVGNLTRSHKRRERAMATLLKHGVPVRMFGDTEEEDIPARAEMGRRAAWCLVKRLSIHHAWGYFKKWVAPSEHEQRMRLIQRIISSPVYGMDMYRTLAASRLAINVHVDVAGTLASNMRMYEATGVASCLVTEHAENISDLFEPGVEVVTYRDDEDLVHTVRNLLQDRSRIERISAAGQARTFRSHSIDDAWNSMKAAFDL